jgi:hypothetical protein
MKAVIAFAVAALLATAAVAQAASASRNPHQGSSGGWSSREHVYAADHYAPWYPSYGNSNMNPDFQLVR